MSALKKSPARAHVVTANRLDDGAVVYLAPDGRWSGRIDDAAVAASEADERGLLARAEEDVRNRRVVGPYAMGVAETSEGLRALGERERIRARGPSVQRELWARAAVNR